MDNVHVAVRVRPLIQREKQVEAETHWKADRQTITQVDQRGKACRKEYVFDRVFASSETTSDVYEEIAQPIVLNAMDGINGTIFAYGQTSSGKTYTMMGDSECPGIIPCTVQEIFHYIEHTCDREFLLRVSYMELYNESLCDLLTHEKKTLQIREIDRRVFVTDLTEEIVTKEEAVIELLKKGEARRHFGQTNMNERSSRSHTIFRMIIESRQRDQRKKSMELAVKVSHLNLVDLAGSERANETRAEGTRLKEACRINQSLHQLAMVINKLSQGAEFIPFRDSKLTRILQMSLGGNAKTAIICTVTPASIDQTHSTLQFASRAKTIKNKPEVNEVLSEEAMMQRQKKEIQELKRKIMELEQQGELLEEKASLHEQQEQKIKKLEKMILVSGAAGIHSMLPSSESKKAKYKRRQTWCPGIGNRLPLLPFGKQAAAPALTEEASFVSSPPSIEEAEVEYEDLAASVSNDDFSSAKKLRFIEDMEEMEHIEQSSCAEESFKMASPPLVNRRKRRRAQVHFIIPSESDSVDAACQTEIETKNVFRESQKSEAESMTYYTARIIELEAKVEELQGELRGLSTSSHPESTDIPPDIPLAEETMKMYKDRIAQLETQVEDLQCQLAVSSAGTPQACAETGSGISLAEETLRHHAARVVELEALVEEMQGDLALSRISGGQKVAKMTEDAILESEEVRKQNADRIAELEALVEELQGDQALRASSNQNSMDMAAAALLQTEEARRQNEARIIELEALVKELQGDLALSRASSHPGKVDTGRDVLITEEAETHKWIFELEALDEKCLVELTAVGTPGHQGRADTAADSVLQTAVESKLQILVEELHSRLKLGASDQHGPPDKAAEVSMNEESKGHNTERIAELEALVQELQEKVVVPETLAHQGRAAMTDESVFQAEEIRRQNTAKVAELEALVEDLQCQLALSGAADQQGKAETSLAEESRRCYLERIASLEVLVEELQDQIQVSRVSDNLEKATEVLLPEEVGRHLARIAELEALVEQLQTQESASGAATQLDREGNAGLARISELETLIEELQGQLLAARSSDQGSGETDTKISHDDEIRRHHEARIAELEAFVEELQAESRFRKNTATADTKMEVSEIEDTVKTYKERITELESLVAELQTQQVEVPIFKTRTEAGGENEESFMEEARKQSAAKITELEALVEELHGQLALSRVSSQQEMPEIGDGISLADEVSRHYEARIAELEALIKESQTRQEAAQAAPQEFSEEPRDKASLSLAEETRQNYEGKIAELEAVVEDLQKQAASKEAGHEAKLEMGNKYKVSFMEETRRSYEARIAELEAHVEKLQDELAVRASNNQVCAEPGESSPHEETRIHYENRIADLEVVIELQTQQGATQQFKTELRDGVSAAEETKSKYEARILELETLVEELQSHQEPTQQARGEKAGAVSPDPAKEMTLADELAAQGWREKAQRTESELLGSVELCEEIMKEKTRLSGQIEDLQIKCTHLENALRDQTNEVESLKELNEFTQLEVTMAREQEAQYQNEVAALKVQFQETEDILVAKHHQEVHELQKKLGSKDKVLEAQYQQDIDELLHKLREKNRKCDALQEQNVSLDQAVRQKDNLVERLQRQLEESETQPEERVPSVTRIEKETQTDVAEFTLSKESIYTRVATQVTPDDLGLLIREMHTQTEVGQEQNDLEAEEMALGTSLQESIKEFEAREARLKAECESLSETISNRDQEIEVLNELLQESELDQRNADDAAKIEAFIQRIEQLEQQLEDATAVHASPTIQESTGGQDLQGLTEENKTLSAALAQAENNCKELMENQENIEKELGVLTEKNILLMEDLKMAREKYEELEAKVQGSENTWQSVLQQHVRDAASQKAAWDSMEGEMKRKIAHLEENIERTDQENRVLSEKLEELKQAGHKILKEKEVLMQELVEDGARKMRELETALELQSSQSQTAANTLKNRDNEIETLLQLLEQQEHHLEASTNDLKEAVSRTKELEQVISAQNGNAGSEICKLQNILEQQEDMLKTRENESRELVSKIQHLEAVSVTNEQKNMQNSEALAEHLNEIQRLQCVLSEQKDQLKTKDEMMTKQNQAVEKLQATIDQQNEKNKMQRALLDERNQRILNHEDKYSTLLAQAQNLEEALRKCNEELQQSRSALSVQEKEYETRISELKEEFGKGNASLAAQEQLTKQLESTLKQKLQDIASFQEKLKQSQQEKDRLESELQVIKASSNTRASADIARLQDEKDEIQSRLEEANEEIQTKETELEKLAALFDRMQQTCSELEDEFEEEKAQHEQTKKLLEEAQSNQAKLKELETHNETIELLKKSHRQQIFQKNLRINELETDIIRGTEPLEEKIQSLRSEVSYQQNKTQEYMRELEKLRSQQDGASSSSARPAVTRLPEATDGSGIIESCAMFAIKCENHKLTKALEKTKKELESKDYQYHDEVFKKVEAERNAQYWKDKARVLGSQLKKFQPAQATSSSAAVSPLREHNTNTAIPSKRMRTGEPVSQRTYTERIPGLSQAELPEGAALPKRVDRDWLNRALAARDAEEEITEDEIAKQCKTQ